MWSVLVDKYPTEEMSFISGILLNMRFVQNFLKFPHFLLIVDYLLMWNKF